MAPKPKPIAPECAQRSPRKKSSARPGSPGNQCLHQSPQKPKRKPKPKPAATEAEVAAQIAARIAQLSAPPTTGITNSQPNVKVKSIAELRSTKIARLTTKIAVNEAEIARLEREYALAKERLDQETASLQSGQDRSPADLLFGGTENGKATAAQVEAARCKLEVVATRAQDLLGRFRSGEISETDTMGELRDLLDGAKEGGCDVAGLCQMLGGLDLTGQLGAAPTPPVAPKQKVAGPSPPTTNGSSDGLKRKRMAPKPEAKVAGVKKEIGEKKENVKPAFDVDEMISEPLD